jgi:hypothetical protein
VALLVMALGGAVACSSGGGGGTGDGGGLVTCAAVDLCAQVPVARVTAVCGTDASSTFYQNTPGTPADTDTCIYMGAGPGMAFEIDRGCFPSSAANARAYYDAPNLASMLPGYTREDLSGLGDAAYFQYSAQRGQGLLYVLQGNLLVFLRDDQATDAVATKTCLTALVGDVLAAH